MSGMPGLAMSVDSGGIGFDYRLSMGIPDMWIKLIKEQPDEKWDVTHLLHELTQHRPEEKTISYAESHDQALVGDKTIIFRLIDKDMYWHMAIGKTNITVERGIALHKMIRLLTASTNSGGYLTFMGNEFGHPEWIDFPREGNDWSYKYARRQWHLLKDPLLTYQWLSKFDQEILNVISKTNGEIEYRYTHTADQVIAFYRSGYLFVFNFNPEKSFTGYGIHTDKGKYKLLLSSDSHKFGGQNRISNKTQYETNHHQMLELYLPSRTSAVYKLIIKP
jgi:1,4-alpha-glucan branching enzyme